MDKNNFKNISGNELNDLINKAFLELDFERAENKKMLDIVADKTFNRTSFFLFNKNILNNFLLFISVLAFIYSFNGYLNAVKAQKVLKSDSPVFMPVSRNTGKVIATSTIEEPARQEAKIQVKIKKVSRGLATKNKIITANKKEETLPLLTQVIKEDIKSENEALQKEGTGKSQEIIAETNDSIPRAPSEKKGVIVKPKTSEKVEGGEGEKATRGLKPEKVNKKVKYAVRLKNRFRLKKRRDHWGGVFKKGNYRKK
jgi:hypothetical protein